MIGLVQKVSEFLPMSVQVDQDFLDSNTPACLQPNGKQGNAPNGHEAFRDAVSDWPEAGTVTGREKKSFHEPELFCSGADTGSVRDEDPV